MRNLEECTAEVFRRSEEKIRKRKAARKRIVACCIPVCLVVVAMLAMPRNRTSDVVTPEASPESCQPQYGYSTGGVPEQTPSVNTGDRHIDLTLDSEKVSGVREFIQCLYGDMTQVETSGLAENYGEEKSQEIFFSGTTGDPSVTYTLSLTDEDGKVLTYTVTGNVLCYLTTGEEVTLSDEQLTKLLSLLSED